MEPDNELNPVNAVTRTLLICGAIAGPLFTVAWIVLGATRADYDPMRHPVSSLAIGELGWTQTIVFLVTGLLTVAFALGLQRALPPGVGSTWGPRLVAIVGVGLIGAGLFVTDPVNGYPPGTPNVSLEITLPGRLHRLFSALVFFGLPAACFVFARHFSAHGQRGWAIYSVLTGASFLGMFILAVIAFAQIQGLADYAGLFQRISLTIGWAWVTFLAVHMLRTTTSA